MVTRVREWYGLKNPEFSSETAEQFCELVISSKKKSDMGADIDEKPIKALAQQVLKIIKQKEELEVNLEKIMKKSFPNINAVAGTKVGALLMEKAGGIARLAIMSSSTVQLLGAEHPKNF